MVAGHAPSWGHPIGARHRFRALVAVAGLLPGVLAGGARVGASAGGNAHTPATSRAAPAVTASQAVAANQPVGFGAAIAYGGAGSLPAARRTVAMASTSDGHGYWLAGSDGGVFSFGDASFYGSVGQLDPAEAPGGANATALTAAVVSMAVTADGHGYWLVSADGGVYSFGDAAYYGSAGQLDPAEAPGGTNATTLTAPVVSMAPSAGGHGYWLVSADGGVYSFGEASFDGSADQLDPAEAPGGTNALALSAPVVSMAPSAGGQGYWLVSADGGVLSFGAAYYGSVGQLNPAGTPGGPNAAVLSAPVAAIAATSDGDGYWLVGSDGGVFSFGDAAFFGSLAGQSASNPVVAVAASSGGGYWLLPSTSLDWTVPGAVIDNLDTAPGSPYPPGDKVVALTFDDGPNPPYTQEILAVLQADHAPASFEIIGSHGAEYPSVLREEAADGMALVNHTWDHVDLATLPSGQWSNEVDQDSSLLQSVTGHAPRCLRPPYGYTDSAVVSQLGERGLAELMWDIDPSDYLMPGAPVITSRVLSALHPGAIIILHDGGGDRSQTVAALPAIINGIRAAGYSVVQVCGG